MGVEEISNDAQLADIGIDSLMGMELARELEGIFKCTLPSDDLMNVTDFAGLVQTIRSTLGVSNDEEISDQEGSEASSSESSSTTFTPSTTATTSVSGAEDSAIVKSVDKAIPVPTLETFSSPQAQSLRHLGFLPMYEGIAKCGR